MAMREEDCDALILTQGECNVIEILSNLGDYLTATGDDGPQPKKVRTVHGHFGLK